MGDLFHRSALSKVQRQQLQQAWAFSLEEPDWAALLRSELEFLGKESLLSRIVKCSGERWRELARNLRSGRESLAEARDKARLYLSPPPDFIEQWQRRQRYQFIPRPLRVDDWLCRSPQPREEGLQGIQRVVNLREESQLSQSLCERLGLQYLWMPVPDMQTPYLMQVLDFLELFREPQVTLVHCYAGQGRTGVFVACYRIWRGMDPDSAISRTDAETGSRGMRAHQREWVLAHAAQLQ